MIAVWVFWLSLIIIVYVYFGYPMALGILASTRSRHYPLPNYEPTVTLLIAAYNEDTVIAAKIENSLLLDYPREKLQILVTADGSTDDTVKIVSRYKVHGVELSYNPERRGKMAAINSAMIGARGEIIIMSDANNLYDPQTVRELVSPFAVASVGAASGSKHILEGDGRLGESEGLYWKYEDWIKKQETRLVSCTAASGEIFSFRRVLYSPPPDKIINDDFYMMMRIVKQGYTVAYVPQAKSYERVSMSAHDEIERRTRIVAGRFQAIALAGSLLPWRSPLIVWQVISHKFLRPLIPFFMILAFAGNLSLVIWPIDSAMLSWLPAFSPYWLFFLLQCSFYLLALLGNWIPLPKVLYLPTFLVNSNMAALLGFFRFVMRRQTALWKRAQRREDIVS